MSLNSFMKNLASTNAKRLGNTLVIGNQVKNSVNQYGTAFSNFLKGVKKGLTNMWYKYTGQGHLTDEAQHAEEREDTINQRTAEDLQKAGISKYAMSPTSAGSSNTGTGNSFLDAILAKQQLKSNALALKEQEYNLGLSQHLGIRTDDSNPVSSYAALAKILFGKGLDELPEDGVWGLLKGYFGFGSSSGDSSGDSFGSPSGSPSGTSSPTSSVTASAAVDAVKHLAEDGGNTSNESVRKLVQKSLFHKLSDFADSHSYEPLSQSPFGAPDLTADQFEMDNVVLKNYSESFWDKLHEVCYRYVIGDSDSGLNINSLVNYYVDQLVKEGFEKQHAIGIVKTWAERNMDQFGFSLDKKNNLWYNKHRYGN